MAEAAVMEDVKPVVGKAEPSEIRSPIQSGTKSETESDRIVRHIMCKLTAFDKAIAESKILEIDGLAIGGEACDKATKESKIKVINHSSHAAYELTVDAIVRQPLDDLILALETGLFHRLHGVTRIVGYYSRVNNWNKSKIGELHDRHKGDYAVGINGSGCKPEPAQGNSEKIESIGESSAPAILGFDGRVA